MKAFFRLLAFGAITTLVASCGRATYSFNSKVPAYLGAVQAQHPATPIATTLAAVVSEETEEMTTPPTVGARASAPAVAALQPRQAKPLAVKGLAEKKPLLPATVASAPAIAQAEATASARPARPSLAQRLLVRGLMATQLHKIKAARQNLARVDKTQVMSKAGRAALIALVGAVIVAIVIAAAQNGGGDATFLVLAGIIGYALLITGIVLLVLSLVNG